MGFWNLFFSVYRCRPLGCLPGSIPQPLTSLPGTSQHSLCCAVLGNGPSALCTIHSRPTVTKPSAFPLLIKDEAGEMA